jgi:leucyl-tRNA synthetase
MSLLLLFIYLISAYIDSKLKNNMAEFVNHKIGPMFKHTSTHTPDRYEPTFEEKLQKQRNIERSVQKSRENAGTNLATYDDNDQQKKFFVTFCYPYMNGLLHLGHAFTISRAEFIARYKRQCGYNVLFPQGFHGTGMPIVSAAYRVHQELMGFKERGSKMSVENIYGQIKILYDMQVPLKEVVNFIDPNHWIAYFPEKGLADIKSFGISIDDLRSFVTTSINPQYDSFVRWQFNVMWQKKMLEFGKKPVIFSPLDNQPCAAHDRSVGEDVEIQEFSCLKFAKIINDISSYLLVATTRLETFFGITNIWINPIGEYQHIMVVKKDDNGNDDVKYFICCEGAVKNLKYQLLSSDGSFATVETIGTIMGSELVGMSIVNIPMFQNINPTIPIIANKKVSMLKGTGIVGSVPGHSIFDYEHYVVYSKDNDNYDGNDIHGVIEVNGDAEYCKNQMKAEFGKKKKKQKLNDLNIVIYKQEHGPDAVMSDRANEYCGQHPTIARENIRNDLINSNALFPYYEPESTVVSRSGDECIVCLTDQWFINYGNQEIKDKVIEHVQGTMELYSESMVNQFVEKLDWIQKWPCSRTKGLGTNIPWDERFVIDSLSDSTVYMAFYTICHRLNEIPTEKLSFEMWEYIFRDGTQESISSQFENSEMKVLNEMRDEFHYWYPLDLRVSGKDLVGNHLPMCLINHATIWGSEMIPKAFAVNGWIGHNGEKMSKSKGNFVTMRDAIEKYGADATRWALSKSGEGTSDANFTEKNATSGLSILYDEMEYCKEVIDLLAANGVTFGTTESVIVPNNVWDAIFSTGIDHIVKEAEEYIEKMSFVRYTTTIHDLFNLRSKYRVYYRGTSNRQPIFEPNLEILKKYLKSYLAIINPICPHHAEHIWNYGIDNGIFNPDPNVMLAWPIVEINEETIYYKILSDWLEFTFKRCRSETEKVRSMIKNNATNNKNTKYGMRLIIYNKYSQKEIDIINKYLKLYNSGIRAKKTIVPEIMKLCDDKKMKGKYGGFTNLIDRHVASYGLDWINYVHNKNGENCEFSVITKWLDAILIDIKPYVCQFDFVLMDGDPESMNDNFYPGKPRIKIFEINTVDA